MTTQILLSGFDVTEFLIGSVTFKEYKTLDRDQLILNDLNLPFRNNDGVFSAGNGNYIFAGGDARGKALEILVDGITFWKGIVDRFDEDANAQTATLKGRNELHLFRENFLNRTDTGANPVELAKAIIIDAGVDAVNIDDKSFEDSSRITSDGGIDIDATFTSAKRKSVIAALEGLAKVSSSDLYTTRGKIVMQAFEDVTPAYVVKVDESVMQDVTRIGQETRHIINDYLLDHSGGNDENDVGNSNLGESSRLRLGTKAIDLPFGAGQNIIINGLAGGVFLGDQYINRQSEPRDWVSWTMPISVEPSLSLKDFVGVDQTKFGYSDKIFEVFAIAYDLGAQSYRVDGIER